MGFGFDLIWRLIAIIFLSNINCSIYHTVQAVIIFDIVKSMQFNFPYSEPELPTEIQIFYPKKLNYEKRNRRQVELGFEDSSGEEDFSSSGSGEGEETTTIFSTVTFSETSSIDINATTTRFFSTEENFCFQG